MKKLTPILLTLTLFSCGPRSGIHNDPVVIDETYPSVETQPPREKSEEHGRKLFKQNCAVCHDIGVRKFTGPGLGGVLDRLPTPSEIYLTKYISNYDSVVKADNYARNLRNEYRDVEPFHDFKHLSMTEKQDIIVYLRAWDRPIP